MSTPDNHGKKAPQFIAFKPLTTVQNTNDCYYGGTYSSTPTLSENVFGTCYSWKVSGMDCATCARRVENTVRQLADVNQVQVLSVTEKLVADADNDIRAQAKSAARKADYSLCDEQASDEPQESHLRENLPLIMLIVMMAISWGLEQFSHPFDQLAFITTMLVRLYPIARQALRLIKSGSYFTIETLMSVAAIGAPFIGITAGTAMVLLLFLIGERLKGWAASRAHQGVSALMALKPETIMRLRNGERKGVAINSLRPGDVIEVAASERSSADGKLFSSFASFDESALARESIPVERVTDDKVPASATGVNRLVTLEVLSEPGADVIDRILEPIEEAEERHVSIERFIDRFSRIYIPAIIAVAPLVMLVSSLLLAASWQEWIYKGLTLLLIGCLCVSVISTPAAITSGLTAAARRGALIKGDVALKQPDRVTQVAFDKAGTLTVGKPRITAIHPATGISEPELLTLVTMVEQGAVRLLAQAIVREAQVTELAISIARLQRVLVGPDIEAQANGERVSICTIEKHPTDVFASLINELEGAGQTVVSVVRSNDVLGIIALQDTLRADAATVVSELNALGVKGVILIGGNPHAAATIAGGLGLEFKTDLLSEDKVKTATELNQHALLAMVDDGINGALAMKAIAIGIAMGNGTNVALETVDTALAHNHLHDLAQIIELTCVTYANIRQNITIALELKGVFLVTTLLGMAGLWLTALANTGAAVLVTANASQLSCRK